MSKTVKIQVELDGEKYQCELRRPSVETLSVVNKMQKSDEVRAASTLIAQCWVGGDDEIKQDGLLMIAVAAEFGKQNQPKTTILKN
jgi:hypothetical protein